MIDGDAQAHAVQGFARADAAAIVIAETIGFGVGQARFDIDQAIAAQIAANANVPQMEQVALGGRAQGHAVDLSSCGVDQ